MNSAKNDKKKTYGGSRVSFHDDDDEKNASPMRETSLRLFSSVT